MTEAISQLQALQERISQRNAADAVDENTERLCFTRIGGFIGVEFYGSPFGEAFPDFLKTISLPVVAPEICSLEIRGPDEGTNGTRNWDFTGLLGTEIEWPHLQSLVIEPGAPEHHNQTIVAQDYDEAGMIAALTAKMSDLRSLSVPSAPDASFFATGPRPLTKLRVESGYDHQNFILNFSRSACFPGLRMLDFGDYNQRYMKDFRQYCTPFEHYRQLLQSAAFAGKRFLILRNTALSPEQLSELHQLRKDVSLYVIQSYGEFVR